MRRPWKRLGACLLGMLYVVPCLAQDASVPAATPETGDAPPAQEGHYLLPDGTPLVLEILDPIGSARARRGDAFRLRLKESVVAGGIVVLAAGIEGVGEIVHAEPSRGGGKPGELILAARRLQAGDRTIGLRGFKLGGSGRDTSAAALGASLGIGPFAHFIHGKEIEIPALTAGTAKLAEPFHGPPLSGPAPAAADAPADATAPDTPSVTPPNHQE